MTVIVVLICVSLAALVLVALFLPKGKKAGRVSSKQRRDTHSSATKKGERHAAHSVDGDESGIRSILETYPLLRDIPYTPFREEAIPSSSDEIADRLTKKIEETISSIKPIPTGSMKLMNLLRSPESNPGEITAIVATNPVFSAKVLQSVNSVYYGLAEKITSIGRAITLLGYNNVRSLVLEDALHNTIPKGRADIEYVRIWVHSAIVSVCAGHLGKKLFQLSEYDCATMGLLHDIGKYFIRAFGDETDKDDELPLVAREKKSYGLDHSFLGALIAERWGLSALMSKAIAYHHHPSFFPIEKIPVGYRQHSFVVSLADLMGKILDRESGGGEILPIRDEYYDSFDVPKDLTKLVTAPLVNEIEKARFTIEAYVKEKG